MTGRKHQLRVHCSQVLKTPILGDFKYGAWAHLGRTRGVAPPGEAHGDPILAAGATNGGGGAGGGKRESSNFQGSVRVRLAEDSVGGSRADGAGAGRAGLGAAAAERSRETEGDVEVGGEGVDEAHLGPSATDTGGPGKNARASLLRRGVPLHLHAVSLQIPALGKASGVLRISAPLPTHFAATLDLMGYSLRSTSRSNSRE